MNIDNVKEQWGSIKPFLEGRHNDELLILKLKTLNFDKFLNDVSELVEDYKAIDSYNDELIQQSSFMTESSAFHLKNAKRKPSVHTGIGTATLY